MVIFFEFVYIVEYVDEFPYIEPSLHHWDDAYLIVMNDHFMCSCIRLARILLNIFLHRYLQGNFFLNFSFFIGSLFGFGISIIVSS